MNCKLTIAFLALSLCAAAQTSANVPGVTLTGPNADPTIVNDTNKGIVAALLVYPILTGGKPDTQVVELMFVRAGEIPARASQKAKGLSTREVARVVSSGSTTLNAVIFSDGEFRGQDSQRFQMNMEEAFQSIKRAFDSAKAGDWDKLKAQGEDQKGGGPMGPMGAAAARRLLGIHNSGGDINMLAHYGKLPAVTWRSSNAPIALMMFGRAMKAFLGMFEMTAHAQSNPYTGTSIQAYPQGTGTDAWHPNQWTYVCSTYTLSTYPCPDISTLTPDEGIAAYCTSGSGYNIGVKIHLGIDYAFAMRLANSAREFYYGTNTTPTGYYILQVDGNCGRSPGNYDEEEWLYQRTCDGQNPDHAPTKVTDTTGQYPTCGADATGYTL